MFVFLFQNFFHVASFVFNSSKEILFWKKEQNLSFILQFLVFYSRQFQIDDDHSRFSFEM